MYKLIVSCICGLFLSACSNGMDYLGGVNKSERLVGEREQALASFSEIEINELAAKEKVVIDSESEIHGWKHSYHMQPSEASNLTLAPKLTSEKILSLFPFFSNKYGRNPELPSGPVVSGDVLYFLDSQNQLSAFSLETEKKLWSVTLLKSKHLKGFPGKGGVAVSDEYLYVTNGSEYVTAIDKFEGNILWQKQLGNISRIAPAIKDARVFVLTADNKLYALDSLTGAQLWTHDGIVGLLSVSTKASINVEGNNVIAPHSSGEIYSLKPEDAKTLWHNNISSKSTPINSVAITDVAFTPVLYEKNLYTGTNNGSFSVIDYEKGEIIFEHENIYPKNIWVSGNSVFVLNKENELLSFSNKTGGLRWKTEFPKQTDHKFLKNHSIDMQGPVLAGSNLWLVDNVGKLYQVSVKSGEILSTKSTINNINQAMFVENSKLYLLSDDGDLAIYW